MAHEIEIPHRLGPFTNVITSDGGKGIANVTFTPGQDGDYSYPQVRWRRGRIISGSRVSIKTENIVLEWTDQCEIDQYENPVANSTFSQRVSWKLWNGESSNYEILLSGFDMQLFCNPEHQPPEHECSKSNAIWPYKYSILINECRKSNTEFGCNIDIQIIRGDSPHPGKSLEYSFDYTLTLHVNLYSGPDSSFRSIYNHQGIIKSNEIHDPVMNGSITISSSTTTSKEPILPNKVVGLRGFSFTMIETDGRTKLGRYMGSFVFQVSDDPFKMKKSMNGSIHEEEEGVKILYRVGITAGKTVYNSKIEYGLYPALLEFGQDDVILEEKYGMYSSCPVCFTADVFNCKFFHLNDTCTCIVENIV